MRILPVALAISAALHTGAIAWVRFHPPAKPEPPKHIVETPIEIVPAAKPDPEPTIVALLDDHTVATPKRVPGLRERGIAKPAKVAVAAVSAMGSTGATTGATLETPSGTPAERSRLMTMRHPKLDKGMSPEFFERFMRNTKPLKPKEIEGERIADEIASAEDNLKNPRWVTNATPDQLTAERIRLASAREAARTAELQPDGAGKKAEHQTFTVKVAADGTAKIRDKANLQRKGLGGSFDVGDALMRSKGIDPYASYKLKVLDDTRDERVAIGKRYRMQQLAKSRQIMQRNLERLVATTTDPAELKQGLFELWDDCAETGSDELVAAGAAAREQVIGFLRAKFPATSPHAFTAAEVAKLNRQRKSQLPFDPYG